MDMSSFSLRCSIQWNHFTSTRTRLPVVSLWIIRICFMIIPGHIIVMILMLNKWNRHQFAQHYKIAQITIQNEEDWMSVIIWTLSQLMTNVYISLISWLVYEFKKTQLDSFQGHKDCSTYTNQLMWYTSKKTKTTWSSQ